MAMPASEARKHPFPLIEQVNEDRTSVEITSRRGDAVLLSRADYDALGLPGGWGRPGDPAVTSLLQLTSSSRTPARTWSR